MKEELFINNEKVDLGTDTKITLNFKSNLMGDISKIVSSNSYTINLPKTVRNRRILDNPSAPAHESIILRKYSNARYIKNGVEIIKNGNAVLLSVSETYEIALTWGVMAGVQDWINDAKKLNELDDLGDFLFYSQSVIPDNYFGISSYKYSNYNPGVTLTDTLKASGNIHPSVYVSWILEQIQRKYGFTIQFPDNNKFGNLMIPLINKIGGLVNRNTSYAKFTISGIHNGAYYVYGHSSLNDLYFTGINNPISGCIELFTKIKGTLKIVPNFASSVKLGINSSDGIVKMPYSLVEGACPYFYNIEMNIKVDAETFVTPVRLSDSDIIDRDVNLSNYIEYYLTPDEIIIGMQYPIVPNLPAIKQIDFLKALCAMFGLFPITDPGNTKLIKLIKIDNIIANKTKAVDWSDKLVPNDSNGEPKKIVYTFNDYSQINWMRYKEDDNVDLNADGSLVVENETLDRENDLIKLPFSPTDSNIINHYSLSDDGTTLEDQSISDRIVYEVNEGGKSGLSFVGLDFKTLVSEEYTNYQEMIRKPVVITDIFRLNEIDLKEIDYTIPVYVKQYGRYYGIIKIQAGSDDLCECDLLQL